MNITPKAKVIFLHDDYENKDLLVINRTVSDEHHTRIVEMVREEN